MAIPTITTDITQIDPCDTTTNIASWGVGAKFAAEPDIYLEGSGSVGLPVKSTGDGGYGPAGFTSFDATANLILIWVFTIPGFISTTSTCYLRVGSNGDFTNHYGDFNIGDRDALWVNGAWRLFALDVNRGADSTTGSPSYTAVDAIGFGANYVSTSSKASVSAIDNVMKGTYVEVTGVTSSSANHSFTASTNTITRGSGSFTTDGFEAGDTIEVSGTVSNDGFYTLATVGTTTMTTNESLTTESSVASNIDGFVTFQDIINYDVAQDSWYGVVSVNRDGGYEINYDLRIGDQSGSSRAAFISRGESVTFAEQPLDTATTPSLRLKTYQDTSAVTKFIVGQSSGTGDNRVGFGGSVFGQVNDVLTENAKIDLSAAIDTMEFFGSVVLGVGLGADFADDTGHYLTNVTFDNCGQVDLGLIEARNLVFTGYSGSLAALLWSDSINIKNSQFLANYTGIEHRSHYGSPYDYYGLTFSGNDYDVYNSSGSYTTTTTSTTTTTTTT